MSSPHPFWFNRMAEHWVIPRRLDLVEHVRQARLQVVQTGTFGPQFYALADDPTVERGWVGMPLVGVRANLDFAADLIPRLQAEGAKVVGQMSMTWHYGDAEAGKGLFGVWDALWREHLRRDPPCATAAQAQQLDPSGGLRSWPIAGRPYRTYAGCMCNPHWLETLRSMLARAIDLGVDGMNVHHNFESLCPCPHCRQYLAGRVTARFGAAERRALFGTADLAGLEAIVPRKRAAEPLRQACALELQRATHERRKAAFDEVFIGHGRALKPDLLLAQWYHKYDFAPSDERSLLPPETWARDEDYIWYSQGGNKGVSSLANGWLADMGLPARFVHAAGGGRPFVINKYDYRRWRLSIAEAGAHHFAALAFHWNQDPDPTIPLADYTGPVFRYQRFLADCDALVHPADPWSQVGLVYPRRAELAAEPSCTDGLRRVGRLLEDAHLLFDIVLDHQLEARLAGVDPGYRLLVLPEVARLADAEVAALQAFAEGGGRLLCLGPTGSLDEGGRPRPDRPALGGPGIARLDGVQSLTGTFTLCPGTDLPRVPDLEDDPAGRAFLVHVDRLLGTRWLETDAPWYVRVRAWRPAGEGQALVLHWVNYRQDEDAAVEVPWPVGPLRVRCALPPGRAVSRVDWLYPEMAQATALPHAVRGGAVEFEIPRLIVYGLSVVRLEASR